jgi:hypothetical protein
MCQEPIQYTLVALSNLAYFVLAIWLFVHKFYWASAALILVGTASTFFHLDPSSRLAYITDTIIANIVIFLIVIHFLPHTKRGRGFVFFSFISFVLGVFLLFESGDDRVSKKYVIMHSAWHVTTALATYFLVKAYLVTEQPKKLFSR